jgi:hypothetical protein
MPSRIPLEIRLIYPVLGSTLLEEQLRCLRPVIHVYGHGHLNRNVTIEGCHTSTTRLVILTKAALRRSRLLCIHECQHNQ